jgi:catechol 2,3-dioxygenase-like lactoylglutathione lyase family enzyme
MLRIRSVTCPDQSLFPARVLALDHCVIAVSDWSRSKDFYKRVLGAEIDQKDEQFGHYRFDDWQLNIHGPELRWS